MDYDVIIVGTGFGATVAVSKLAHPDKRILMLERGTFWQTPEKLGKPPAPQPGDPPPLPEWAAKQNPPQPVQYWPRPDHSEGLIDLFESLRILGNDKGLYQYSRFDQADILTASGVGGGSLIYSNATLQPDAEVLTRIGLDLGDPEYQAALKWMRDFRGVLNKVVTKIPLPASRDPENLGDEDFLLLDRSRALRDAAGKVSEQRKIDPPAPWRALELAIADYHESGDGNTDVKNRHTFCERQGRCVFGCLPQARHTLNKTLYKHWVFDPKQSGVELRPLSEVLHVRRIDGGYEVTYKDRWQQDGHERTVTAPMVVMGAGTLGTNEILLRSHENGGLALSGQLGQHFSTNGNFGGFCLNTTNSVFSTRGPVNTCHVDFHVDGRLRVIEDCSIPSMIAAVVGAAVQLLFDVDHGEEQRRNRFERFVGRVAHVLHIDTKVAHEEFKLEMSRAFHERRVPDLRPFLPHPSDTEDPSDMRTEAEVVENLFFFNCMGEEDDDKPNGRFTLDDDDELDLTWNRDPGDQKVFADIEQLMIELSQAMGGDYVPLPGWKGFFGDKKLTITHPLGGCRIGDSAANGVVDEHGRVFDTGGIADSTETYPGLIVVDGSVIPGSVVAHPTLTIVAQALKTMDRAVADGQAK